LALVLSATLVFSSPVAAARADKPDLSAELQVQLPKYDKKSLEKLKHAALAGNAKAEYDLGTLFLWGRGVSQDFKTSENWFRKSTEADCRPAQIYLAGGYGRGIGLRGALPNDAMDVLRWYLVAAANEMDPPLEGEIELIKRQMAPPQIAEAERRARAK
jgi:TPR repeat protein